MKTETRKSPHIGDLFHGIGPVTPDVGQLFFNSDHDVGIQPLNNRKTLWMDIKKLYRAHYQTVELIFESEKI